MLKMEKLVYPILLFLLVFLTIGCSDDETTESTDVKEKSRVSVRTKILSSQSYDDYISAVGTIKPYQKALLSSNEGGKIVSFLKDKGKYVSKGDTILIIDNEILEANLQAAKAQYELAQITFEKQEMVYKENVNSEIQYLQAKFNLQQLEANYKLFQTRYKNTFIVAPFAGIIDQKFYDEGELAPMGSPILLLIDVSRVKVEAGISETFIGTMKKGDDALINVKAIGKEFSGKITFVGSSVNVSNRTFPIEITLSNKGRLLKPELNADVQVKSEIYDSIIIVPTEIISRVDEGYIVYVIEDGKAQSRKIDILKRTGNQVAVKNGLKDGDELIVVGYQNLVNDQAVSVIE